MRVHRIAAALVLLVAASQASAVLDIVVSFDDTALRSWTALEMGVVNQAVSDWENAFNGYDIDATVDFGIDFRDMGSGICRDHVRLGLGRRARKRRFHAALARHGSLHGRLAQ